MIHISTFALIFCKKSLIFGTYFLHLIVLILRKITLNLVDSILYQKFALWTYSPFRHEVSLLYFRPNNLLRVLTYVCRHCNIKCFNSNNFFSFFILFSAAQSIRSSTKKIQDTHTSSSAGYTHLFVSSIHTPLRQQDTHTSSSAGYTHLFVSRIHTPLRQQKNVKVN